MAGISDLGTEPDGTLPRRGFGVAGALAPELIRALAAAAEAAGYATFWVNDGPVGEGLAALREAASMTTAIGLAVGAIPLDRVAPERIAARIAELELPMARLIVGLGAGGSAGGLERVRRGIAVLRQETAATLAVAAMGPKMCRLAGEVADGVLLDWATPSYAERVMEIVAESSREAVRPLPWVASYVFTALGAGAIAKLQHEAAYYAAIPAYAAHFARMGTGPLATTASGNDRDALLEALRRFDAVLDEPVVRAVVAEETLDAYLAVLRAAAPG